MLPLCSTISWWLLFIMHTCSVQTFIDNRGTLTWFIIVSPDWIPPDEPWAYSFVVSEILSNTLICWLGKLFLSHAKQNITYQYSQYLSCQPMNFFPRIEWCSFSILYFLQSFRMHSNVTFSNLSNSCPYLRNNQINIDFKNFTGCHQGYLKDDCLYLQKCLEYISPFCGVTDTPVLDFWWYLP